MGAYELIEALKLESSRRVGPPTVYRALEFLTAQGFVSRIESLNAYMPCAHPERDHDCLFFICSGCRASVELEDPRIEGLLAEDAAAPRLRRDTPHGRGRGHVRAVRGSRRGVGGNEEPHPWRRGGARLRSGCCRSAPGPG